MGISKKEVLNKFKELKFLSSLEVWTECINEEYWKLKFEESEQRRREAIDSMLNERKLVVGRSYNRDMKDGTVRVVKYEQALDREIYKFSFVDSGETFKFDEFEVSTRLEEIED